jgi:DNA-binding CsgD family transcriptional regulator
MWRVEDENRGMAALSGRSSRQQFVRLLHRGLDLAAFFEAADRLLAGRVPFDSSCWLSLDPATLLPTGHFTREVEGDHVMELAANEFLEDDVNKFAALARARPTVATLWEATRGDPGRSPRFTRVLAPHGYGHGDELRATFVDGDSAWGCAALHRRESRFEERDVAFVAEVSSYLAEGIRRAIIATALRVGVGPDQPGLILLRADDSIESVTAAARRRLDEMVDSTGRSGGLPLIVVSVANRARLALSGRTDEVARARVPRRAGGWLLLHASLVDDDPGRRVGVILQTATTPEIAPLIAEAHGLSRREREVTRMVLYGLSTREIADGLGIAPYTVQDHLKAIFEKVGVRSRRELVAQLFLRHYAPRLEGQATIGPSGWFAELPTGPPDAAAVRPSDSAC